MSEAQSPEWLKTWRDSPAAQEPPRRGGFKPGQSGNPAGRPKGARNKTNAVARAFDENKAELLQVLVDAAKAGDMTAMNLLLQRAQPPLRSRAPTVEFELSQDRPLSEQAGQILKGVSEGVLDPDTGKLLIDCIQSVAGIRAVDELEARLVALEEKENT